MEFDRKLIVGVETECGLADADFNYFSASDLIYPDNEFRPNGSRLYLDGNRDNRDRLEVATPEAPNPAAGIACLNAAMHEVQALLPDGVSLFQNNVDFDGQTWGTHENYLCRAGAFQKMAQIAPHLATRIIYTGAGFLNDQGQFLFSSRIPYIRKLAGWDTTSMTDRSLINTRDEPHSSLQGWKRLHLICGESNITDQANFLKLGTTAVVLKLIEDGRLPSVSLTDGRILQFMHALNADAGTVVSAQVRSPLFQEAIHIQRLYCHAARDTYVDEKSRWFLRLIDLWGRTLDALERDPWEMHGEIDWLTKMWVMQEYQEGGSAELDAFVVAELSYSQFGSEIREYLRDAGIFKPLVSEDGVLRCRIEPPGTTRAHGRGRCLDALLSDKRAHIRCADWDMIEFEFKHKAWKVLFPDPQVSYADVAVAVSQFLKTGRNDSPHILQVHDLK